MTHQVVPHLSNTVTLPEARRGTRGHWGEIPAIHLATAVPRTDTSCDNQSRTPSHGTGPREHDLDRSPTSLDRWRLCTDNARHMQWNPETPRHRWDHRLGHYPRRHA